MKIEKFNYKKGKDLIFDTIYELSHIGKIEKGSFNINYFKKEYVDIKKEIKLLIDELKEKNFDLMRFIEEYEDEVFKDFDFISNDAFMDTILYTYDKNKADLGGLKLIDSSEIEYVFKYKYGYYSFDMGKRYILQSFNTLDDYYKATANNFLLGLLSPDYSSTSIGIFNKKNALDIIERCSIVKQYDKGYTIYVHLEHLYIEVSKKDRITYDEFVKDIENDISPISHRIFENILEIFIGYRKKEITLREFDEIKNKLDIYYQAKRYNI